MLRTLLALSLLPALAQAASPVPEITRPEGKPQAVGVVHTLRGIPETCVRLEGMFTGQDAAPYRLTPVKTHPQCQPRARLVSFEKAQPSADTGWKLNERVVVAREGCPSQQAVLQVWRKPGAAAPPKLDAQGRSRIYLEEAKAQAQAAGTPANVSLFAVDLKVVPGSCPR
jgi:hypothetical protein